jgi:hypothetical protein
VMSRIKAVYRSWAVPCRWHHGLFGPTSPRVVGQDFRTRSSPPSRALLPATGFAAALASSSAPRVRGGEPQASCREGIAPDSFPRSNPCRFAGRAAANATPFRTKRQLWAYSGFAVETHDSGEYRYVRGKVVRNRERISVRALNGNYNRDLKNLFESTAISASTRPGPLRDFYLPLLAKGMRPRTAIKKSHRWVSADFCVCSGSVGNTKRVFTPNIS